MSMTTELQSLSTTLSEITTLQAAIDYAPSEATLATIASDYLGNTSVVPSAAGDVAARRVLATAAARAIDAKKNLIPVRLAAIARLVVTADQGPGYIASQLASFAVANPSYPLPTEINGTPIASAILRAATKIDSPHW